MKREQKMILVLAMVMAFMATVLFLPGLIRADDLEPSALPRPRIKTLDEIYEKLEVIEDKRDSGPCEGAPVEKTGQTTRYNEDGTENDCTETGQDRDLQKDFPAPPRGLRIMEIAR